jgi:hypothetical protein
MAPFLPSRREAKPGVDFEPDLEPFYLGACGFGSTPAGLIPLPSLTARADDLTVGEVVAVSETFGDEKVAERVHEMSISTRRVRRSYVRFDHRRREERR